MSLWEVLLWLATLAVPVATVFFGAISAGRAVWRDIPLLSPLVGTVGVALAAWLTFVAYWLSPVFGLVFASALLIFSVIAVVSGGLYRDWRRSVPLMALLAGAITFAVAFSYLWGSGIDPYSVVAGRYFHFPLPSDSTIPMLLADRVSLGESTNNLLGDWNGGDRPPLQTGFELLVCPMVAAGQILSGSVSIGFGGTLPVGASFAADVLAQFLWIPAGYSLLRLLGFGSWAAIGAVTFASFVPTVLIDSVFTWPKMLSAALVLSSVGFLIAARQATRRWPLLFVFAMIAATLAVLAHGAAAFCIPALLVIGLNALWGRGFRVTVLPIISGTLSGILLYAPWIAYQRFIDPPGDRLLKWHLAGYVPITPEPFTHVLVAQYASLPFSDLIGNRVANAGTVMGFDQLYRLTDPNRNLFTSLRVLDWTSTAFALGALAVGALLVMITSHVIRLADMDALGRQRMLVIASMLLCIAVWVLVLFSANAAIVAQGSHAWILALTTIPVAWLLTRNPRFAFLLVAAQASALIIIYFAYVGTEGQLPTLSIPALLVLSIALPFSILAPLILTRRVNTFYGTAADSAAKAQ